MYAPHVTLTHPHTAPSKVAAAAWEALDGWALEELVAIEAVAVIEFDGLVWRTVRQVSLR